MRVALSWYRGRCARCTHPGLQIGGVGGVTDEPAEKPGGRCFVWQREIECELLNRRAGVGVPAARIEACGERRRKSHDGVAEGLRIGYCFGRSISISGSYTFVLLNSRLERHTEEEEERYMVERQFGSS